MDSLTARHLARELDGRWRGRRVEACTAERASRTFTLAVAGSAVCIDLASPRVPVREASWPTGDLVRGWTVTSVSAPTDDRRLVISLERPGRFKGSPSKRATLTISAVPTARGAELRVAGGAVLASVGSALPPPAEARPILADEDVSSAARARDTARLLEGRWVSPLVARWLASDPAQAADRYRMLCDALDAKPTWCGDELVPFPMCDGPAAASLIEPLEGRPGPAPRARPAGTLSRTERVRRRIEAELERAREAPHVRAAADAVVALGATTAPPTVRLADGTVVSTDARSGETSADVAERLYARARSMERALERLPARLAALETARDGGERERPARRRPREAPRLPYRTYRSSSGRDIWVGRGASSNDALTFRHAAPDDVWLHARDAAGAHVVLRWSGDEPPPPRDLQEAAQLAAWHSKARGARVVPVDWTRRKHVRKPRGAAPGLVLVQHVKTIFVRPDASVERALRYAPTIDGGR